ncbi:MAG TPA: matrixin family metalloprotease [Candidatus Acidoferrales bacterium]|nr:matrixin family metalloprotease [Candidatus Acidoferrales bacterium]
MMRANIRLTISVLGTAIILAPAASAYLFDSTAPRAPGCPQTDRWSLSLETPLDRQWSASLPTTHAILTVAPQGTSAQRDEVEQAIEDSFGAWTGVVGTTFNTKAYPGMVAPLVRVASANACSNDQESNVDGRNTICFNQPSAGFTAGVLAFTRVITANAPGVSIVGAQPATFAGQILDADTLFRPDGQVNFATPAALAGTPAAYDLESLLTHEIGHWFGLDHSAVWRAIMFPYAPPPGQFLGARPSVQTPDGPLSDDDRTGIRALYPDPQDAIDIGTIHGRVLPANLFSLVAFPSPPSGRSVTGVFGAHVVITDSDTGAVVAGSFSGWSCNASGTAPQFDGSYDIERLPVGHNYTVYAEPLDGLAAPADFSNALNKICASSSPCTTPAPNTTFNPRVLPTSQ